MVKRSTTKSAAEKTPRKPATTMTPARKRRATKGQDGHISAGSSAQATSAGGPPLGAGPAGSGTLLTIRHYCQGIGDCHLLKIPAAGGKYFFMLIDCGVHSSVTGGPITMAKVVADIATVTKHIDVLVITHEHWDHLSAFITSGDQFNRKGQLDPSKISVGQVWAAWTENQRDRQARQLDKYKDDALSALRFAAGKLNATGYGDQLDAISESLNHMLGFYFGATGDKVRSARDAALALGESVVYHEPGAGPLPLEGVDGVKVYVLGPPRDAKLLGLMEQKDEMYGLGSALRSPMVRALSASFGMNPSDAGEDDDWGSPFDPAIGKPLAESLKFAEAHHQHGESDAITLLRERYFGVDTFTQPARHGGRPEHVAYDGKWRRIDGDWLSASADLAMQLDQRTNNTSLVLAFELSETKRVLLFAADAQIGNWLSWRDLKWGDKGEITGPDLLKRTVYYKVGHHGSHNATATKDGLELMTSPDLSAFIPVNEQDAMKVRWGQMPYKGTLARLYSLTQGRTARADDDWVQKGPIPALFNGARGSIKSTRQSKDPGLWVEFDVA